MARIIRQTTVIRDNMHNAFTDLQFWQGAYWVSYRKGADHISMDAHAVVSVSHDRHRFTELATSSVRGDVRDPKMFPIDDDHLALYYPTWLYGAGSHQVNGKNYFKPIQQYITFSTNGHTWQAPQPILAPNMWLWRIRPHQGRYYGLIQNLAAAYDDVRPHQLDLAVSDDLINWETIARIGENLNESDIFWHPDGEAWVVSRTVKGHFSVFAAAKPPYTEWHTTTLTSMVHAPIILEHNDNLYVAGRSNPIYEGPLPAPVGTCSLSLWRLTRGQLDPVLHIPAYGDCSYPGLIKDPEGRICLSYYSQHAYNLGVITPTTPDSIPADVYFAELEL
ncbi:MAG: exo-alpha-sialidase [Lentisphaerae bacterium]|jgi:hypothetical protein|nr:exo-alpha-sialidase [Lentisphaerota bacterium]